MKPTTLGILGGLGPASGICFARMLVEHTRAERDQDHINFLLSSHAATPDRTDFILGRSREDPVPVMIDEVRRLTAAGADLIAIPCNTAHHFYHRVAEAATVPLLNIIDLTVAYCRHLGARTVGVLATEGTVRSGAYETACARAGLSYKTCRDETQAQISHLIYGQIKQGLPPDVSLLSEAVNTLLAEGCEAVVLGCTELSLLKPSLPPRTALVDSLEVLALCAIRACGKEPVGFDEPLLKFNP